MAEKRDWPKLAVGLEVTASIFTYPTRDFVRALSCGEIEDAALGCGIESAGMLAAYRGMDEEQVFERLRVEHTDLFYTVPTAKISPYGSSWIARKEGFRVMQGANSECLAVLDFYRNHGMRRCGSNEPVDHIATELEFLELLASIAAGLVVLDADPIDASQSFNSFIEAHLKPWACDFVDAVRREAHEPVMLYGASFLESILD